MFSFSPAVKPPVLPLVLYILTIWQTQKIIFPSSRKTCFCQSMSSTLGNLTVCSRILQNWLQAAWVYCKSCQSCSFFFRLTVFMWLFFSHLAQSRFICVCESHNWVWKLMCFEDFQTSRVKLIMKRTHLLAVISVQLWCFSALGEDFKNWVVYRVLPVIFAVYLFAFSFFTELEGKMYFCMGLQVIWDIRGLTTETHMMCCMMQMTQNLSCKI